MCRIRNAFLAALAVTLGLASIADAGWIRYGNTVRRPDGNLAHASNVKQMVVLDEDAEATEICISYSNGSSKKNKGKVKATATVNLAEGDPQVFTFNLGVKKNAAGACKKGPAMPLGTIVDFDFVFEGMPLVLGRKGQQTDIRGVVSAVGEPSINRPVLTLADEDEGGRIVAVSATFEADKASQKHPGATLLTLVPAREMADPTLCVLYHNNLDQKNKGRVVTQVRVFRGDNDVETTTVSAGVKKNAAEACKVLEGGTIAPGTMIEADVDFRKMPKLKMDDDDTDYGDVSVMISRGGDVTFVEPEVVDTPPVGGGGGDGGGGGGADPPPSSGISADDQRAVSKLLLSNNKVQLQRPKGNNPAKFVALGPKSTTLPNDTTRVDPSTAGLGSTIAAAVADYERKKGSLGGAGGLLNSRDLAAIKWYANMNTAAGPTSIRKDSGGGWHSEYWRPSTGNVFIKASSMATAIEALQKHGL